jgi:spermidine/putrescine transport system permease protein
VSAIAADARVEAPPAPARTPKKRWTRFILPAYSFAFILYLSFPIFVIILFSFNDTDTGFGTAPRVKTTWVGFTTVWYKRLFDIPDLTVALKHSLLIAFTASLTAAIDIAARARPTS